MYREIEGDLIELALAGEFDVIAHGCNCFCTMGAGIAPQMVKAFGVDKGVFEESKHKGNYNKLGMVEPIGTSTRLIVLNCYTQYDFGSKNGETPLDYTALALCLQKINHTYAGEKIGLPQIGCGLAGGDWDTVRYLIQEELKDCDVTVVIYKK